MYRVVHSLKNSVVSVLRLQLKIELEAMDGIYMEVHFNS